MKIYSTGLLSKFLTARFKGASRDELDKIAKQIETERESGATANIRSEKAKS